MSVPHGRKFRLRKWIFGLLAVLMVAQTTAVMASIQTYSTLSAPVKADAAVVLGAAVWRGQPSPVFRERINHAIELYQDGQAEYIIFTGGQGRGDDQAESEVARQYAIGQGIPENAIYIETISYNNLWQPDRSGKTCWAARNLLCAGGQRSPAHEASGHHGPRPGVGRAPIAHHHFTLS